ncbi:sigma-70 family RNA polymerase sigma factor [Cetobacterium sp. 2G large]|uniref:sigma-70 family RNA polymerase sigma factor n=1 Tax=Cetobacterium sp. 2G large TaxID=2759680 RepID=UPI00163C67BF|nr:sigma-70 family RNA polymerase sigma factor [Cetobacterium sp. 2G large]MBC2853654.1 sigma-70 family RNA polymerase sigma factor [Cetobacterium sp. 2G large]
MDEKDEIFLAQQGDEESIERILKSFEQRVYKSTQPFFLKGGDRNDLVQEGFIGLIKAIKNYDENKEASFSTFATLCIKRQMITAIRRQNLEKHKVIHTAIQNKENPTDEFEICKSIPSFEYSSPEDILLGKELARLLQEHLNKNLTKLEKRIFYYFCQQYNYLEISKILNESPKRVDNTIQRIKRKVKSYLKSYLENID